MSWYIPLSFQWLVHTKLPPNKSLFHQLMANLIHATWASAEEFLQKVNLYTHIQNSYLRDIWKNVSCVWKVFVCQWILHDFLYSKWRRGCDLVRSYLNILRTLIVLNYIWSKLYAICLLQFFNLWQNLQLQDLSVGIWWYALLTSVKKDEDDDTYNELQLHIYQCLANVYYQCAQAVMTKKVLKKGYKLSMK